MPVKKRKKTIFWGLLLFVSICPLLVISVIIMFFRLLFYYPFNWKKIRSDREEYKKTKIEFHNYFQKHKGEIFFCYTNKKKTLELTTTKIIPKIKETLPLIFLKGRIPESNLNSEYLSFALKQFPKNSFPCIIGIGNGMLYFSSLHDEILAMSLEQTEINAVLKSITQKKEKINNTINNAIIKKEVNILKRPCIKIIDC